MEIDHELMQQAIDTFGEKNQKAMVLEEALELALSLAKLRRGETGDRLFNLADECADINIMVAQLNLMMPQNIVQDRINFKQNRLRDKIRKKLDGSMPKTEVQ